MIKTRFSRIRAQCFAFAALAVLTPRLAPADGLTVVSTVSGGKGTPTTSTQYITPERILTSDGRLDTTIDVKSGKIVHVDHKKKQWYETSFEEMRAQLAQFEEMLGSNPIMGSMLGKATEVRVEKGSGTRQVAGYDCHQYLLTLGKKMHFELWVAPDLATPLEYYEARKVVYAAMGPIASRFEKMFDAMKEIDGFPLVTKLDTKVVGMKLQSVSEATEVRKGSIDPGVFEPPAGYKKKKSPYEQK